jgi:hypothetical protein
MCSQPRNSSLSRKYLNLEQGKGRVPDRRFQWLQSFIRGKAKLSIAIPGS